ncbi:MAG: tyrosine/phenylalanine carboxypeptidase domain-containing protein [Candidatus Woesearchaeota archaeon]|jgi:uncharacterized protein (TIGR02421 family)
MKTKVDPKFTYHDKPTHLSRKIAIIKDFQFKNEPIDQIFKDKQQELLNKCRLYANIGKEKFTSFSKKVWGRPDKKLIDVAYDILDLDDSPKQENISSKASLFLLKDALREYRIHNLWRIEKMDRTTSAAAVRYHEKVLSLKKKERFSKKYIQRLIVHEVGTHILRYENSLIQPLKILRVGLSDYLTTEEGLAAYNENENDLLSKTVLRQYAGRVVAVDLSLKNSFTDTFKELRRSFDADSAFKLALRTKRGISDSSLAGGCTKDYVYLKGYLQVQDYIESGNSYEDLYIGKVGIENISVIKKIPEIRPARFIPHPIEQMSINSFVENVPLMPGE